MSASLFRSLASSWLGLVAAILVGLVISPFVVRTLGAEDYGFWAFVLSLTSQFVILDLGARQAVVSFVARYRHEQNKEKLSEVFSSAFVFFSLSGAVAFLLMLALLPFLESLAAVPENRLWIVQVIFLVAALDTAIEIIFGLFDGVLAGSERYDVMSALNVTRLILSAITIWIVLSFGLGVLGLALTTLTMRLLQRVASLAAGFRYNPGVQVRPRYVTKEMLKRIGKFSAGASIIHASNRLIYRVDTVIAGIFLSAAAVTSYAIPLILIDQFRMFAESGNGILTPRFSKLAASGDQQTTRFLLLRWSRYSFLLALAIGTPLLITGGDFLELWMGRRFPEASSVLTILTLPFLLTMPAMVFTYYLYATNRHAINARILALEAVLNLVLSLILVQLFGLVGIALGTLIPAVLCRALLLPIRACSTGIIQLSEYVRSSFLSCIPLALIHAALLAMTRQLVGSGTWFGFLICNALALAVFTAAVWGLYLSDEEKAYLGRRLGFAART